MATLTKLISATPQGYEQLTVSTAAVGLTVPTSANLAVIVTESAEVRYRDDGTDPTVAIGTPVSASQSIEVIGASALSSIRFIRTGSSDATLNINYYTQ